MAYRFQLIDAENDDAVELLTELHTFTFGTAACVPDWEQGWWWIGWEARSATPAAFCGFTQSTLNKQTCYFKRAGVLKAHQGQGLQRRMIRVRERHARRLGYSTVVTDTTDNIPSANNLIAAGYKLWHPEPWAFPNSLYWRKFL